MDFPIEFGYNYTDNSGLMNIPPLAELNENGEIVENEPWRLPYNRDSNNCEVCWSIKSEKSKIKDIIIICIKQSNSINNIMFALIGENQYEIIEEAYCYVKLRLCFRCQIKHKHVMNKSDHFAKGNNFLDIFDFICNVFESSRWEKVFNKFSNKKLIKSANLSMNIIFKAYKENDGKLGMLNTDVLSVINNKVHDFVRIDAIKNIENMWYKKSVPCDDCGIRRLPIKLIDVNACASPDNKCCRKRVCFDSCNYWCLNDKCCAENIFYRDEITIFENTGNRMYKCWKCLEDSEIHIIWIN
jgi:hypothetical protein